ncbi:HAD-IIIC family phosphatase [Streptomyces sp. CO7]
MSDDLSELTRLHRDGSLAAHYPRVRGLLAELTGDPLARAGRLLARLDPDDVLAAHPGTPAPLLALTGHGTLTGAVPALTAELARHGLPARIRLSPFDSWVFDLVDPASELYAARPDLVLCLLDPATVTDDLPTPWGADDVGRVLEEKLGLLERAAEVCATAAPGATLVLNTLPLLQETQAQLLDLRARARLGALWRRAEARLLDLADRHPHVVVVDLLPLLGRGVPVRDVRQSVYARAHLSDALLAAYAREVGHLARLSTGGAKKVLALDLDNTVWGGVLGEVGPDGIETDGGYRGEAFRRFQLVVRQLAAQGVLVTAVSKNDLEPVEKTLREHPRLALREEDFVRIRANWRPKHENIAELAAELNLGADSFVFVDDSSFERGLVRRELPGVAVVAVDEEPALHPQRLLEDGWFTARELTEEDLVRPARYREERSRQDFLHLRLPRRLPARAGHHGDRGPCRTRGIRQDLPDHLAHQPVQPHHPAAPARRRARPGHRPGGPGARRPRRGPLRRPRTGRRRAAAAGRRGADRRQLPAQLPGLLPRHRTDGAARGPAARPRQRAAGGARRLPPYPEERQGRRLPPARRIHGHHGHGRGDPPPPRPGRTARGRATHPSHRALRPRNRRRGHSVKTVEDYVELLRDELALPVTADDIGRPLDEVTAWDSVHLLTLCTLLERETGRPLSLADVLEAPSLEAVYRLAVAP